jgi:hypothetical protein
LKAAQNKRFVGYPAPRRGQVPTTLTFAHNERAETETPTYAAEFYMSTPRIFFSYTSADRSRILPLIAILTSRGIAYYDYQREPLPSENLRASLRRLVADCDALISIMSDTIIHSDCFKEELVSAGLYDIPHCVIQIGRHPKGDFIMLGGPHTFIDAADDASLAATGLVQWLDNMGF